MPLFPRRRRRRRLCDDERGGAPGGPGEGALDRGRSGEGGQVDRRGGDRGREEGQAEVVARHQVRQEEEEGGGGAGGGGGRRCQRQAEEALLVEHIRGAAVAQVIRSANYSLRKCCSVWAAVKRGVAFVRGRLLRTEPGQ